MSNYSPKVIEFLKINPDFEKDAKEAYKAAKNFKADNFKAIKPETKAEIEKKFGTTIDANKLTNFSSIAKKLNEQEFVSWIAGDTDAFPAIQLNQAEMALVKGAGDNWILGYGSAVYPGANTPTTGNSPWSFCVKRPIYPANFSY